jgi:hypothetical protein
MEKRVNNTRNWVPMMYVTFYGIMRDIALEHGYVLTVHGSCVRDFDVPWVENPKPVIDILNKWSEYIGGIKTDDGLPFDSMTQKPHGRISYTMQVGGGGYIDVSVMPTNEGNKE